MQGVGHGCMSISGTNYVRLWDSIVPRRNSYVVTARLVDMPGGILPLLTLMAWICDDFHMFGTMSEKARPNGPA
jgi:hypothetical protein